MNIQQFEYVLAVAKHRHFETAAESCFVAQSTLSTMLSRFEEEIGIQIFDRRRKPVEITNEGEQVIEQIRKILNEINQLNEVVRSLKGELATSLRIGIIPTIAPYLLPLFLQKFSTQFPQVYFEIQELNTEGILKRIETRELDIGILSTSVDIGDVQKMELYEEDFVLFDASAKDNSAISFKDIDMSEFWMLEEGHCMRTQILEICEASKIKINPSLNLNYKAGSIDSLLRFVKTNKGKTMLPAMANYNINVADKDYVRPIIDEVPYRSIGMVIHEHFTKFYLLNMLKEIIRDTVKDIEGVRLIKST